MSHINPWVLKEHDVRLFCCHAVNSLESMSANSDPKVHSPCSVFSTCSRIPLDLRRLYIPFPMPSCLLHVGHDLHLCLSLCIMASFVSIPDSAARSSKVLTNFHPPVGIFGLQARMSGIMRSDCDGVALPLVGMGYPHHHSYNLYISLAVVLSGIRI